MVLLQGICDALGLSLPVGRFLLYFVASIPACWLHRFIGPTNLRHAFAAGSGSILSYLAFGAATNYYLSVPVAIAYVAMLADRRHCGTITFIGTFAYLIVCHVMFMSGDAWKQGGIDFTGSLMILVLKVTSCAMDYQDGLLPEADLKEAQRNSRLHRLPNLLEFFGYTLCCGTHFAGPVYEMRAYLAWTERKEVWATGPAGQLPPRPYLTTAKALAQALACMGMYLHFAPRMDLTVYSQPSFLQLPFWQRLSYLVFTPFAIRWKYYFIWSISEAAMAMAGLGFSGWDASGKASWKRAKNTNILGVELATSAAMFPLNWNISVSNWLRIYVYDRLTPKGRKGGFWELLATQVVSAVWHGLYPGYLLYFVGTAFMISGSRVIYSYQKNIPANKRALKATSTALHSIYAQLVNNYASIGFLILSWSDTIAAYRSVYFIGLLLPISVLICGQLFPPKRIPSAKPSDPKKEQ